MQAPTATATAAPTRAPPFGLPPLPALPASEFRGPTPWSNWVISGRVLAGAYPANLDDDDTDRILTTLLGLGVNTFVCLQAEFSLHNPESAWRAGQGLRPYIKDAQRLLIRARETNSQRIKQVGACAAPSSCLRCAALPLAGCSQPSTHHLMHTQPPSANTRAANLVRTLLRCIHCTPLPSPLCRTSSTFCICPSSTAM